MALSRRLTGERSKHEPGLKVTMPPWDHETPRHPLKYGTRKQPDLPVGTHFPGVTIFLLFVAASRTHAAGQEHEGRK